MRVKQIRKMIKVTPITSHGYLTTAFEQQKGCTCFSASSCRFFLTFWRKFIDFYRASGNRLLNSDDLISLFFSYGWSHGRISRMYRSCSWCDSMFVLFMDDEKLSEFGSIWAWVTFDLIISLTSLAIYLRYSLIIAPLINFLFVMSSPPPHPSSFTEYSFFLTWILHFFLLSLS